MTNSNLFFALALLFTGSLFFTSCSKVEDLIELSEKDASEIIESALQKSTGGFVDNLETFAQELANEISLEAICDSLYLESFTYDYQGSLTEASYASDYTYQLTCNDLNIPQSGVFSSTTDTDYNTPRIESDDTASFDGDVSGLEISAPDMIFAGTYNRGGLQELSFANQRQVNSTLEMDLTGLTVNKETVNLTGGTGTVTLSGTTQDTAFSHSGSITFNGNDTATLILNGTTYVIDLN